MAKTTQEKLLDSFEEAAGSGATDSVTGLAAPEGWATLADAATGTKGAGEAGGSSSAPWSLESGAAPRAPATKAVSSTKPASGGGVSAGSVAKTIFESGLGLIPLIGGLIGLFDGGSNSPPPLTKYVMPPSLDFQAADSGGALTGVSYDQMGNPRTAGSSSANASSAGGVPGQTATQSAASSQNVDARWFLDHSSDIAAAVRNAMLNLNSINDVVNDL